MLWSTNYGRLLSQTLFTLFFAGRSYAPKCIIDNQNIQDWLQSRYIKACGILADRISDFENGRLLDECVIGWDSLNEPFEGFSEWEDLNVNPTSQGSTLKKGTHPTPAQSLRLGMGIKQTVENYSFGNLGPARDGDVTIDPKGLKIWAEPLNPDEVNGQQGELPDGTHTKWGWKRDVQNWPLGTCIWALHGVWDLETGYIIQPDYFKFKYDHPSPASSSSLSLSPDASIEFEPVEFMSDHWKPHFIAYATRIRQSHPLAILFVQPPVFAFPPPLPESILQGRCAYSPHYYDGLTLVSRHWNWFNADALGLIRGKYGYGIGSTLRAVKIGENAIRKSLQEQLGYLKADVGLISACTHHDNESDNEISNEPSYHSTSPLKYPTLIGEIGTPFDMDSRKSYGYTDKGKYKYDYTSQTKALDASMNACDGKNGLNWTIWGYVPDDHTWEWGDGWNMEDLSLWSWADWREEGDERCQMVLSKQPMELRPMVPTKMETASSTSLSSLSTASSISGTPRLGPASIPSSSTPSQLKGYSPNPYDFLTNGARAVKAFARPWPTKVVGIPVDITFDIGKGVFKLEIEVRKEDGAWLGRGGKNGREAEVRVVPIDDDSSDEEEEARKGGEKEDEEGLATEIYIPLVHFAHPKVLQGSWMANPGKNKSAWSEVNRQLEMRRRTASDATATDPVDILSSPSLPSTSTSTLLVGANSPPKRIHTNIQHQRTRILNESMESIPDLVDVEVEVSGGRWSVCGQTLKWWYDVPGRCGSSSELNLGRSEDGVGREGEDGDVKKYWIEIKRRGGPIHIGDKGYGGGVEKGQEENEMVRMEKGRECCEELCEGGCLIM